jgi:hypothetical protein
MVLLLDLATIKYCSKSLFNLNFRRSVVTYPSRLVKYVPRMTPVANSPKPFSYVFTLTQQRSLENDGPHSQFNKYIIELGNFLQPFQHP